MRNKFYVLVILLFYSLCTAAQTCSGVQINCTTSESRCVSTGSINVSVTGGSGNYNYRVTGPVSTPLTSSSLITGLEPGYYTVIVADLNNNCTVTKDSVRVTGSYSDPRFQLVKTDAGCAGNDGTISVQNRQFGRAPFLYTIVSPSPSHIGATSAAGSFSGLVPGEYAIELRDSCGGIQVRRITIENYNWWIDSFDINRVGCDSANAFIKLVDNRGNVNTSGSAFNGFTYAVVLSPGDTVYTSGYDFRFLLGHNRNATIVVKDNCGTIKSVLWSLPESAKPFIGPASLTNYTCSTFRLTVPIQQNLTSPSFCLYRSSTLVGCNGTGLFNNLPFGSYCIQMEDACYDTTIVVCFNASKPVPAVAAGVSISNQSCTSFNASITGQANLINPNYCLKRTNGTIVSCNSTGVFTNITYGNYCIEVQNGCSDTTITRCFSAVRPLPQLTTHNIWGTNCSGFSVTMSGNNLFSAKYCLYDSSGQLLTCDSSGTFAGLPYGNYCIRAINCGDSTASYCFTGTRPVPAVASQVQISNRACTTFTATITGQTNLSAPQYCLYNSADTLLTCNTTGVFAGIAYGTYCIKIKDSCTDSTIVRCFTVQHPAPSLNAPVQQSNGGCSGFTATITGSNLTNPEYCLMDTAGTVIQCNTTGVFGPIPWGRYCFRVKDGCIDTTMTICQTFTRPQGISLSTSKACVIGSANVTTLFTGGFWPFRLKYYKPTGELLADTTTNNNPFTIVLPGLPAGATYKVVGYDGCNFKDSAFISADASAITRSITVAGKCPSATWQNGAGDLKVTCSSNLYPASPVIIKKNGAVFNQSFSSVSGNLYTFSDLEPATYIVEYNMQTCNSQVWDTVTVQPYAYPTQGQSAIYQCDNNTLSLGANVLGGLAPFTYQIIGSTPSSPSITSGVQNSPIFTINTGTIYSLVRLRAVDACGNASLDDVSVLPLQNFTVTASQHCFYRNVLLSVDTIANASYTWYRKTTPVDSVLLGNGAKWNLPFFEPEEVGQYVCHINVHNGCANRVASFTLDGDCGNTTLPTGIRLNGKKKEGRYQLDWQMPNEQGVLWYVVERKSAGENRFTAIASVPVQQTNGSYQYKDFQKATAQYRIKVQGQGDKKVYSNVVTAHSSVASRVYPNPVKEKISLFLSAEPATEYHVQLFDANGRNVLMQTVKNPANNTVVIPVNPVWRPGVYLLRLRNQQTGDVDTHTLMIQQ